MKKPTSKIGRAEYIPHLLLDVMQWHSIISEREAGKD
jgi:hypothetical protein